MRVRHWRALLAAAAIAVTASVVISATPAVALSSGTRARIMAKSSTGQRFYPMPTGELRANFWPTDLYTFVAKSCGKNDPGECYEIQSTIGDEVNCLFYWADFNPPKIQYGACGTKYLTHRWHIDSLKTGGLRMRPASHPTLCVVYDPVELPDYLYTFIEECSSSPLAHTRFWLVK